MLKQKDGESGLEFHFNLQQKILGVDEDGDDITSCVVVATDERPSKGTQSLSDTNKLAMNALEYCLADQGRKEQPRHDYPAVTLVDLNSWYEEMESRSVTDGKDKATIRVQRNRIRKKLTKLGLIGGLDKKVWKVT